MTDLSNEAADALRAAGFTCDGGVAELSRHVTVHVLHAEDGKDFLVNIEIGRNTVLICRVSHWKVLQGPR
jgi:hypothetical protein